MSKEDKIERIVVPRFTEANGYSTSIQKGQAMAKIRGKNTKPELSLRKALWALNYKYRINVSSLPGKPDIVLRKYKLVIFVDGEFWHGYNWEEKKQKIKSNRSFWIPKIERNMQRDRENELLLKDLGYTVLRFWEHEIKKNLPSCITKILGIIENKDGITK